jgi:hypothetical protein
LHKDLEYISAQKFDVIEVLGIEFDDNVDDSESDGSILDGMDDSCHFDVAMGNDGDGSHFDVAIGKDGGDSHFDVAMETDRDDTKGVTDVTANAFGILNDYDDENDDDDYDDDGDKEELNKISEVLESLMADGTWSDIQG